MPLAFGPQIEVVHEGLDYYVLHVRDTLPEDSGIYRVIATNSAGSASCQATLKVERVTHIKKEVSDEGKKKQHDLDQQEMDKKVRLTQILAGADVTPLTPVAQQALREAATMYKPAITTKKVKSEADEAKEKEEKKKRAEEKRLRMPYVVPLPRIVAPTALDEDMEIKHFVPFSDMKWYKKLRDQYEFPEPIEKFPQKRLKRIRLSRWDQFYEVPLPRIKDQYKPKWHIPVSQDDLETVRPARYRTPSPEMEAYYRIRRRSLGDLSDEELLLPVKDYLSMKRTEEERLKLEDELELGYSASPPSLSPVRFELSALRHPSPKRATYDEEEGEEVPTYDSYRIPSKYEAGPSYIDLRQRHERATYRPPRQKQRLYEEKEDHELLRSVTTTTKLTSYKSQLQHIEFEEKTKVKRKEKTRVSVSAATEAAVITDTSTTAFSPGYATVSHSKKPSATLSEKGIKTASPEKTRPRSPSLDTSEKRITTQDLSTQIDYMSRYESRKKALKTERKFEIVSQQPFTLDHAPRVTVRMRSHRVPIGQNTKFTLNVQSKPEAQINWYHNGQQIEESKKYRMFNMSGVLSLQIIDCQEEDSGTYRVVCTNAKGEASDYATLDVAGGGFSAYASQRKDEEPPTPFVPEMTKTDVYHVSSITAATASETQVEISETKTERIEETIKTSEIKLEEVTAVEEVVVKKLSETKLEATEVTTVVEEVVEKKKGTPATILTKPQSLTVSEGESVKFTCDVDGEPAPTVTWMREGHVIVSSRRYHVTSAEYTSTFEITQVEMSDGGNYTVVVENSDGTQEAQFSLTIRKPTPVQKVVASPPRVKSPESPRIKSPFGIRSPQRIKSPEPVKSPPRVKSPPMVKSPTPKEKTSKPTFSTELKDISASVDTIIKLTVKLSGEPKPTIFWMKDGKVRTIFLLTL